MKQKQLRRKTIIVTLVFLAVGGILFKSIFTTSMQIYEKKKEQKEYTVKLEKLKDKEDELNNTVTKLQDYVARYAREKYLYSKDGEIIIRIPD
jgi:cell division protein DivIC